MSVWIVQCLCGPARHCLLAAAEEGDTAEGLEALVRVQTMHWIATGVLNPWCSLCGARVEAWVYEIGRTSYGTLADAEPALRALEAAQLQTAAALKAQGRAYDGPTTGRN